MMTDDGLSSVPNLSAPLVSVIVASFIHGSFVRQALESVAGQDYSSWDCLVVDDCSRDDSAEMIAGFIAPEGSGSFRNLWAVSYDLQRRLETLGANVPEIFGGK